MSFFNNDPKNIFLLVLPIIVVGVVVFLVWRELKEKRDAHCTDVVYRTSYLLADIMSINDRYKFHPMKYQYQYVVNVQSKQALDHFNFDRWICSQLSNEQELWKNNIKLIKENRRMYDRYMQEINKLHTSADQELAQAFHVTLAEYLEKERQLCAMNTQSPTCDVIYEVFVCYTSPQGRNTYQTKRDVNLEYIERALEEIKKRRVFQSSQEYERSKMTQKLRYEVMQRDGFRCVLCGRSAADGVRLEVDHVIPVSKGGRTEMSNLRTLCIDCNRGKGARYSNDMDW